MALALAGIAICLATAAGPARARTERLVSHRFEEVWPTAVRFLRVDQGYSIVEKDAETGYVLFELKEDDRRFRGSLELVRTRDSERRPAVELILKVEDRPDYVELVIMDHLLQKIRDEHGDPPPPPPAPPDKKKKKKDAD